jgi:hypothetical protein
VYVHSSINPECTSLFYCVESWVYDSASGTGFGSALAVVPDSDGDGMPELFVGAEFASGNGGAVYGYEASYTMGRFVPTSSAFTTATFENSGDHLGASIASLGTFTDDSLPDLAFGAWGNDAAGNEAGVVYTMAVHNESADTIFLKMGSAIRGSAAGDFFGYRVCAAGDTDGDGSPDLLAGAPLADNGGLDAGAAYLLLGGALSSVGGWPSVYALADVAERTWNGLEAGDNLYTCAPGGDNDADGYADILLGAQNAGTGDGQGAAYLVLGSSSTALISEDLVDAHASWSGAESGDAFSNRLAMDGDFDADGLSDIVITAPNADDPATEAGAAWVFLGAQSGAVELADASLEILGVTAYEQLGIGLATGDLDGSGADDLVLGAPYRGGDDGAIYIFLDPP